MLMGCSLARAGLQYPPASPACSAVGLNVLTRSLRSDREQPRTPLHFDGELISFARTVCPLVPAWCGFGLFRLRWRRLARSIVTLTWTGVSSCPGSPIASAGFLRPCLTASLCTLLALLPPAHYPLALLTGIRPRFGRRAVFFAPSPPTLTARTLHVCGSDRRMFCSVRCCDCYANATEQAVIGPAVAPVPGGLYARPGRLSSRFARFYGYHPPRPVPPPRGLRRPARVVPGSRRGAGHAACQWVCSGSGNRIILSSLSLLLTPAVLVRVSKRESDRAPPAVPETPMRPTQQQIDTATRRAACIEARHARLRRRLADYRHSFFPCPFEYAQLIRRWVARRL